VTPAERIAVDGEMIPEEDLADVVKKIRENLPGAEKRFTYFEMFTLMAMFYFRARGVDYAVFETGLGGRLDATNVLEPDVCGITPISYDHMKVLGERIEEIASEKAAIIKNGSRCVSSPQCEAALGIIRRRCGQTGSSLSLVGDAITYDIHSLGPEGSVFDIHGEKGDYEGCRVRMPGDFQVTNCATAVGICENLLGKGGEKIDPAALKRGIENAFIPGRMEILSLRPAILIDGAQNGESAAKLKYSVERIFKYDRLILLLGLCRDKDIESVCRELAPAANEIVLTKASTERAADPHVIRGYIRGRKVSITSDVKEALGTALSLAKRSDLILATGSFYVIGEVRELLRKHSVKV
jgi:dihydrofolate synthase/folylpolyglutamate synthase